MSMNKNIFTSYPPWKSATRRHFRNIPLSLQKAHRYHHVKVFAVFVQNLHSARRTLEKYLHSLPRPRTR